MLFSLLKHYLDLYISDTALKVSRSLYYFTTSVCHGVENYFPRLWGMGISDAIFLSSSLVYNLFQICIKILCALQCLKLNAEDTLPHFS